MLLLTPSFAQTPQHPNYDDDVKPIFARRCFACHNAAEARSGLNLESYASVLRGGGSGEAVISGRPAASLLYKAVSHEDSGAPQMPLGGSKIPDVEIDTIREWIARGLAENASSQRKAASAAAPDFQLPGLSRPEGPPAMPELLPGVEIAEPARAHPITALAASPWAPLLAVAGHERIYLYNLDKRSPAGELAFPEGIPYALRFSRDGAILLAAGGRGVQSGKVVLFEVHTGKRLATLGEERDIILAADISADGKLVAMGGPGKIVKVFSVSGGNLVYQLTRHTDWITALEFSPDGKRLTTADRAGGIRLWESTTGANAGELSEHKDSITALSWRGGVLASGSEDGQVVIWDAAAGFPIATVAKAHGGKGVLGIQFTSDGRLVSLGRDSTIRAWGLDGKAKGASAAAGALLTKIAASFDRKLVIAGDYEGRILLWDGRQPQLAAVSPRP